VTAAVAIKGSASALGGLVAVGALLIVIGVAVHLAGTHWNDVILPPVVTGSIVALIGLNLAPAAKANFEKGTVVGIITLVLLVVSLAFFRGILGRLAIFLAVVAGYLIASVLPLFLPAVVALIAENIGHVKSVGQMTGTDTDPLIGRALAADGAATLLAGLVADQPLPPTRRTSA
jgi:xanthine/uracil permease